jgi:hypothetical protein
MRTIEGSLRKHTVHGVMRSKAVDRCLIGIPDGRIVLNATAEPTHSQIERAT